MLWHESDAGAGHAGRKPSSAVSQVLQTLGAPGSQLNKDADQFYFVIARDQVTRMRAVALAHRIYHECGYATGTASLATWDERPDTFTLLVQDKEGMDAATVSLVFDTPGGLPCDSIFAPELAPLRTNKRRLVEVMRLAIEERSRLSRTLLLRLFNGIFVYAKQVKSQDDFLIEVNPRHVKYYCRLLGFEQLGDMRPCPRVQGAPAVLLRLDLNTAVRKVSLMRAGSIPGGSQLLYEQVCSIDDETALMRKFTNIPA